MLRLGEVEEQLARARGVGCRPELAQVEPALEMLDGVLVGEHAQRVAARALDVVECFHLRTARRRGEEVMRQLRQVRLLGRVVARFEDLAEAAMQCDAVTRTHLLVDRLSNQRVREAVPAGAGGDRGDDAAVHGGREPFEQRLARDVERCREQRQIEVASGHGGGVEQIARGLGQWRQPLADGTAHAVRPRRRRGPVATTACLAHDLVEKERIAAAGVMQLLGDRLRYPFARRVLDEARHLVAREAAERQRTAAPAEPIEGRRRIGRPSDLRFTQGAEHHHRPIRKLVREKLQHVQRRQVGPVQIVEDDQQGHAGGDARQAAREHLEETKAGRVGVRGGDRRGWGRMRTQLGHQLHERLRIRQQRRGELRRLAVARTRLDHLCPRPVGGPAFGLVAASPEHAHLPGHHRRGELVGQTRLADPGLAAQQIQRPTPAARGVERSAQLPELRPSADHRRALSGEPPAGESVRVTPWNVPEKSPAVTTTPSETFPKPRRLG